MLCAAAQTGMQGQGMQGMQGQGMQGMQGQGMQNQGMTDQGVPVQGMGDGQGMGQPGTEGRNTEVGGGVGDFNIDTGSKGRDAGARAQRAAAYDVYPQLCAACCRISTAAGVRGGVLRP